MEHGATRDSPSSILHPRSSILALLFLAHQKRDQIDEFIRRELALQAVGHGAQGLDTAGFDWGQGHLVLFSFSVPQRERAPPLGPPHPRYNTAAPQPPPHA